MTVERLKQLKIELGYSNSKLSEASGVPLGTVNKILSGETKNPRYETIKALENALTKDRYIYKEREESFSQSKVQENTLPYFTINDYYALNDDKRHELIDGVLYDMAAPSIAHQRIVSELMWQINSFIRENRGKCEPLLAPKDVKLDKDDRTMVQPDLIIVCNPDMIKRWGVEGAPDFVLEVVSPSSISRDYIKKACKYQEAGVREYWIVDPIKSRLLVYYFEESSSPYIQGLEGQFGVKIYNDELLIDLEKVKNFAELK